MGSASLCHLTERPFRGRDLYTICLARAVQSPPQYCRIRELG